MQSPQVNHYQRRHCSWTLYSIYFNSFNTNINKFAGLLTLSVDISPLKQWAFDDSHSPKYQKFKIDELPKVISYQQDWNWKDLISYYQQRYHKTIRPIFRRVECDIPKHCTCPACDVPVDYLMWNDGRKKSQVLCKVCQTPFFSNQR